MLGRTLRTATRRGRFCTDLTNGSAASFRYFLPQAYFPAFQSPTELIPSMHTYETLQVGDTFSVKRVLTSEDVQTFADLTGDDNPLHVDPAFAATTRFGKPIVHGVLLLGIISKVLGRDFPGPGSVAVGISCRFLRPVPVGSEVTVEVRVAEKIEKHRHIKMRVYAYLDGKLCVGGEATLIPPAAEEPAQG